MKHSPVKVFVLMAFFLWAGTVWASIGQTTTITNNNGDLVTLKLSGPGNLSVSLVNSNRGPIDKVILQNTGSTSTLAVTVKKSRTGSGRININAISGDGSLKNLSAKSADIVGSGINLGGSIGLVTIGDFRNSALRIGGNGVVPTALALASLSAGTISNSLIQVGGRVGKVSATQMLNSQLWQGYNPVDRTYPMTGGTFTNGSQIFSVSVTGLKGTGKPAFVGSTIAAQSIGSITLAGVNSNNNGVAFGILATNGIKSVSVKQPKFSWQPNGSNQQGIGDFQVRLPATVQITVASNLRTLTTGDVNNLTVSNNVYILSTNSPAAQGVHVGDVLVSGIGKGSLVKVLAVTNQGGSVVLHTTTASLTNIFQQAAFNQKIPFVPAMPTYLAPGVHMASTPQKSENSGVASAGYSCNFNFSQDLAPNGPAQVLLTGSAGLNITPNQIGRAHV